jgi:hypothetical protein
MWQICVFILEKFRISNIIIMLQEHFYAELEMLDFLMGYESYLRKRRISVSSRRYKPTGKHRHSLR